jgi:hypothetical protein
MGSLRVLAHAHSTWSYDGRLTLGDWRRLAAERGCGAVLFAEHEESGWNAERYVSYVEACAAASDAGVRLIPGVEFSQGGQHVLCYGLRNWPDRPCSIDVLAHAAREQGCVLCLAHPGRYRWTYPASVLDAVDAIEVWNSSWVCDGSLGPHPRTIALAGQRQLFVGQDVHKRHHLGSLYFQVPGDDPIEALRTGAFEVVHAGRAWSRGRLLHTGLRARAQQVRTGVVRGALQLYRGIRRAKRRVVSALDRDTRTAGASLGRDMDR